MSSQLHESHSSKNPTSTVPRHAIGTKRAAASACTARRILDYFRSASSRRHCISNLPSPSPERLAASLTETPVNASTLTAQDISAAEEKGKSVLYLAYGSNLCKETFRDKRGIRPLAQVNVVVPELKLTFDLPGIPYSEPCFANTGRRDPNAVGDKSGGSSAIGTSDYHKDRWHKGLVGCVYEVTPTDYAHIIATEGGGASYHDILVKCYPLPDGDIVPEAPKTAPFLAHTLFAPDADEEEQELSPSADVEKGGKGDLKATDRFHRPDPSYAQPSARYLKLITDGALELSLPLEYRSYLSQIRPYTITSQRQQLGQFIFLMLWQPFLVLIFALMAKYQDEDGRSPDWVASLSAMVFEAVWTSYDGFFHPVFGDGERTEKGKHGGEEVGEDTTGKWAWRRVGKEQKDGDGRC